MKTYDDYIRALDQLLQKAALIPRGEWPNIPRPRLSKDAPRVLIFSPHPDDEVIISHLPLRLMRESKMQISNVAVTLGSKKGRRKSRLKELRNSCQFIGFDLVRIKNDGLENINPHTRENNPQYWSYCVSLIASILDKNRPDIIFYPHVKDWHTTHIGTHYLVVDGLKSMGHKFSTYCIETETWGFMNKPNLLVECKKKDIADLITALSFHRGEIERNPYHLSIANRLIDNVMRGTELIKGQGTHPPSIQFASLYKLKYWKAKQFHECQKEGNFLLAYDNPANLFKHIK